VKKNSWTAQATVRKMAIPIKTPSRSAISAMNPAMGVVRVLRCNLERIVYVLAHSRPDLTAAGYVVRLYATLVNVSDNNLSSV
jgi:hypothetical protein